MASLKCKNCGFGIHYHDEANGVQIIAFSLQVWNKLIKTSTPMSRYTLDETDEYYIIWRCENCNALHFFYNDSTSLSFAYKEISSNSTESGDCYICFSDYDWDILTESGLTWEEFLQSNNTIKSCYFCMNNKYISFYQDENFLIKGNCFCIID